MVEKQGVAWFVARLESLQGEYRKQVDELAERVRQEVIIPACRRRKMTFTSGMGDYFFSKTKPVTVDCGDSDTIGTAAEAKTVPGCKGLVPIFELLDLEVESGQPLGYYIGDVSEKDLTP